MLSLPWRYDSHKSWQICLLIYTCLTISRKLLIRRKDYKNTELEILLIKDLCVKMFLQGGKDRGKVQGSYNGLVKLYEVCKR